MSPEYIGGRNAVLESLKNKRLAAESLMVSESASGTRIDQIISEASDRAIPVRNVPNEQLDSESGSASHQGVLLEVSELHPHELDDLLALSEEKQNRRLFVLDQVQDPVNLGKIARIALYFGFDGLVKTRDRTAPLSSTVIETSAGAAARLPIAQVKNLRRAMDVLKDNRFWLVGTVPDSEQTVEDVPVDRDLAVILGHEGSGIRRLIREESDYLVRIPGDGALDSLNVATAGAVSAYALQTGQSLKN